VEDARLELLPAPRALPLTAVHGRYTRHIMDLCTR
jgi:hypothetical protein